MPAATRSSILPHLARPAKPARGLRRAAPATLAVALLAWSLALAPARAVPPDQVSMTAKLVCEFRAIGAGNPDPKLRNGDTMATKLCDEVLLPRDYDSARAVIDLDHAKYVGYFSVNARTRYIDEQLAAALAAGATQVVVLGAGFDSRAYRFHDANPQVSFYEVDLPPTIRAKQKAVTRVLGTLPSYVKYAPIDFDTQSLQDVLAQAGYDPARRTFFVLEGVTMYVSRAGNDATFDFVGRHSPPGSRIAFDWIDRRVAEGDYGNLYTAASQAKGVAYLGEPWVTGWTHDELVRFLGSHNLRIADEPSGEELVRRYLTGSNGKPDGRLPDWGGLLVAVVR